MGHALRTGISFCEVSDRLLFLDLVADRYFCLGDSMERAFRSVIACEKVDEREALTGLVRSGILVETAEERLPQAFRRESRPGASLLDTPARSVGIGHKLAAISALATTHLSLRLGGLHRTLNKLAHAKLMPGGTSRDASRSLHDVATAFEWTARIVRSHDQCLPRSIAVARRLAALGLAADLVIGVRLRPFAAHCWVEVDGRLVNDRLDTVRTYTPILSV